MQNAFERLGEVYFSLCKSANTPQSLGLWLRFKYGEIRQLAEFKLQALHYNNAHDFAIDYGVSTFLSKFEGLDTGIDRKAAALLSFRNAEDLCRSTNQKFRSMRSGFVTGFDDIIHIARRKIARILGPLDYASIIDSCRWGPGATLCLSRRRANPESKCCTSPLTVSPAALDISRKYIECDPNWTEALIGFYPAGPYSLLPGIFKVVDHNRVTFVPKNAKTERSIAVEPRMNGFFQQGIGRYMRRRMERFGIILDDQSINQKLAARSYFEGLATLDLSSASDTISLELVYELLPLDWFLLLSKFRSEYGVLEGERFKYEKFSSMGNAFTFELESLIFWALCSATDAARFRGDGVVSVFGDDIVVSDYLSDSVVSTLEFCGFRVNLDKSFSGGCFYESCGKHFFKGIDVTPLYQKENLSDLPSLIRCHNRVYRWSLRLSLPQTSTLNCLRRIALKMDNRADRYQICFTDHGDDGWIVPFEDCSFVYTPEGIILTVLREIRSTRYGKGSAMFANWLRTNRHGRVMSDSVSLSGLIPIHTHKKRYRSAKMIVSTSCSDLHFRGDYLG